MPKAIEERQEEESVKKVLNIADVRKSKKDASSVVLKAKGGSSMLSAGIQATSVVTVELLMVILFHFEDKIWPKAINIISSLKKKTNPHLMMMVGDHSSSAWHVAKAMGIEEVYSILTPEDKLHQVKVLSCDGVGGLIMVGNGINDAPALAATIIGIVLIQCASATTAAVVDVLLLEDNIGRVPFVLEKAHQADNIHCKKFS